MDQKTALEIYSALQCEYSVPASKRHFLMFENPYQILILTILSAQTTDSAVNRIAKDLFSRYPAPGDLAGADQEDIENLIREIGLYRNKARNIILSAQRLVSSYDGKVPDTMDDLLTFPGVGRKTANIVLNHAFGIDEGIAVDTHVRRVSHRIGLTDSTVPDRIERDLMEIFPHSCWGGINYLLIRHGRTVCTAKRPRCSVCIVNRWCRYFRDVEKSKE